ncbi:MAG: hypothetical protein PHE49_05730, partial [bacterium]|nr:hypothetical protein [bacterium]
YFLVVSQFLSRQDLLGKKVEYYWCRDEKELNAVLGFRNKFPKGTAMAMYQKVFSTFPCDSLPYIASLFMYKPFFIRYGIYSYSKKETEYAGYSYNFWIANRSEKPSLNKSLFLSGYNGFVSNAPIMPNIEFSSLFAFLMEKLGEEKIKDFIRECKPENAADEFEKITGERLEKIEAEWIKHITGEKIEITGMDSLFTPHFKIKYDKEFKFFVEGIGNTVEDGYKNVCDKLSYFPDENKKITINFFNNENFLDETGKYATGTVQNKEIYINTPIWSYEEISSVVSHELTHLFVFSIIKDKAISPFPPLWFYEGLPRYAGNEKKFILLYWGNTLSFIPPERIKLPKNEEDIFWETWACSAIEFLFENWGKEKVNKLLVVLGETGNFETAFRKVIGISTSKFERLWKKDIKKKFWTY